MSSLHTPAPGPEQRLTPGPLTGPIVGVLLCAGWARRHGGDKLGAPLTPGCAVAVQSARRLREGGCDQVLAVLRPAQTALARTLLQAGMRVLGSEVAGLGMGHSLAAGIQASAHAGGWVVALGDMPLIQADSIARVVTTLRQGHSIVTLQHHGERGHPVGWHARWGTRLAALSGDEGARQLIRAHAAEVTAIAVDDPGILLDIDTPDDLLAARATAHRLRA